MKALPIKPDPALVMVVGPYNAYAPDETLAAQVEMALRQGDLFTVTAAHTERVGFLRRRTVTVIDGIDFP